MTGPGARAAAGTGEHLDRARAAVCQVLDPRRTATPEQVGRALAQDLVTRGVADPDSLAEVLAVVPAAPAGPDPDGSRAGELDRFRTAFVVEYMRLSRARLLAEQEDRYREALAARTRAESRRDAVQTLFTTLFEGSPVGIGIADTEGRILRVNAALERMLGYREAELAELGVRSLVHPDDAPEVWRLYDRLVAGETDHFRTEKRYLRRDGSAVRSELSLLLIRDQQGRPSHQMAIIQDITRRHALEVRLRQAARHDALTGLPNRRMFLEDLEAAVRTAGPDTRLVLCLLDVDDFSALNDTWGHLVADLVLQEIGVRLDDVVGRTGGRLARLGGDEFVVLLRVSEPGEDPAPDPEGVGARLHAALARPVSLPGGPPVPVRVSLGLVELPPAASPVTVATAERLLQAADLARRAATPQHGRARVVRCGAASTNRQLDRVGVMLSLPGVAQRSELDVVYQPMVRLADEGLHGVEALVRWRHPDQGVLPPDAFIPVAEQLGEVAAIGDWVLRRACRDLTSGVGQQQWPAVNINLSAQQLYRPTLVEEVRDRLRESGLEPHRLRVELTESMFADPGDLVPLRTMHGLAELGVQLVLDDFGTGYSNLAALRRLPLHEIKLAASFVQGDGPGRAAVDRRILDAVVDLVHDLGLT